MCHWSTDFLHCAGKPNLRLHMPPVQFCLANSLPWQYRPPLDGFGLLQSRLRNCKQSGLHEDHEDQEDHFPSTAGHIWLQVFFSTGCPSQPGPLLTGAGLLQIRVRFRIPRPHVALHSDQDDHVLHCPGTERTTTQIKTIPISIIGKILATRWRRRYLSFARPILTALQK